MAVKATFQADFSNFLAAAQAAEGSLDKLAAASGITEASVKKVEKSFSGQNIIAGATKAVQAVSAIGGVSALTDSEVTRLGNQLDNAVTKMQRLGVVVPDEMKKMHAEASKAMSGISTSTSSMGSMFSGLGKSIASTAAGFVSAQVILGGLKSAFSFVGEAAIGMNANLEKSTLQFTTLMGNAQRAEKHVRDLFEFAKRTPFETGPIITASKHMQTFGGDALNTMANLTLLGDASAATSAPIEDLGFWVGRMYAAMQGGQPFGEATARLMELGVLTPQVRAQMDALSGSAGGGERAFALFQSSLGRFSGAMVDQANTWDGLMSSISDAINITLADALLPFFDTVKTGAKIVLDALGSAGMKKVFETLKQNMSEVFGSDGRGLIVGLMTTLISFGKGATVVAEGVYRTWSALKLVFAGTASLISSAMLAVVSAFDNAYAAAAKVPGIGDKFKPVAHEIHLTRVAIESSQKSFHDMAEAALSSVAGTDAFAQTMAASRVALDGFAEEIEKSARSQDTATAATKRNTESGQANEFLTKQQIKAAKEHQDALDDLQSALIKQGEAQEDAIEKTQRYFLTLSRAGAFTPITTLTTIYTFSIDKLNSSINSSAAAMVGYSGRLNAAKKATEDAHKAAKDASIGFDNFSKAFSGIGETIIKALQGGGDALKAVGASLGKGLGEDIGAKIGVAIPGKIGQALGSAMGPLGAMAGSLLGAGFSKALGWVKDLFGGGDKTQNLLAAQAEAAKKAQEELNNQLEESKTKLEGMRTSLSGMQTELDGLIGKAYEMGYVFNQQGQLTGFNFQKVAQVAKDFGVDLAALGPAFQQAQLTAEAQKVIDAFTLLTMSGADVGGVLVGMKDEINKIVNDSLKFGTVIPDNMKPWIAELIRTGQLTDANGQKITDISQIKFGQPVKSEYEKINSAIETVVQAMNDLLGQISSLVASIDRLTADRTMVVRAQYEDPGPPEGFGDPTRGRSGSGGGSEPQFATGTMGQFGRWFANFGSGTRAVLHGNEAVVRADQAAAFAADMGGGGNGAMAAEIAGLRADMNALLPRAIGRAVRDAMQLSGAMA
jgi:hypothetical protein